jgi:hypothetical protein
VLVRKRLAAGQGRLKLTLANRRAASTCTKALAGSWASKCPQTGVASAARAFATLVAAPCCLQAGEAGPGPKPQTPGSVLPALSQRCASGACEVILGLVCVSVLGRDQQAASHVNEGQAPRPPCHHVTRNSLDMPWHRLTRLCQPRCCLGMPQNLTPKGLRYVATSPWPQKGMHA